MKKQRPANLWQFFFQPALMGSFPGGSVVKKKKKKNLLANAGDMG